MAVVAVSVAVVITVVVVVASNYVGVDGTLAP